VIGEDLAAALPELRAQAESLMVDTCTVTYIDGTTWDEDAGASVPNVVTVYSGKCRVQRSGAMSPREASTGTGYEVGIDAIVAQLPLSATGLKRGHTLTVNTSQDPDLVGVKATVQSNLAKTHATKRTLVCEEAT
jgi:hypothetical protein